MCLFWQKKTSLLNDVLANIVSNSLKFSFPNSVIHIKVRARLEHIEVIVLDNGIGMSDVIIDKVFEPYTPTSRLGTQNEKGTGFGMPLAKSVMDEIGGSIGIESSDNPDNSGTTVTLRMKRP